MKKINLDTSKLMGYKMAVHLDAKVGDKPLNVRESAVASPSKLGSKVGQIKPI